MKTVEVKASGSYKVYIGGALLGKAGELTRDVKAPCNVVLVSDDIVYPLYGEDVKCSYERAGYSVTSFVIKNGEASKSMTTLARLLEFMAEKGVCRSDLVVALGGGVVGDLAGFAAAVYMRGIDYVQLPTTLLAAVDSSVGGKTAVDLTAGKNLAGAFYQPKMVLCDTDTLKTLTPQIFSDGAAEIIKYGAACDLRLFEQLEAGALAHDIENVIYRCVDIKRRVVEQDEYDTGTRAILNFGHTLGHAIEKQSGYTVTHGAAVAIGMVLITSAAEGRGITQKGTSQRLCACIESCGLKATAPYSLAQLFPHCMGDKKRSGDSITLVLLRSLGECCLNSVTTEEFKTLLGL